MNEKLDLHATDPDRKEMRQYEGLASEFIEYDYFEDAATRRTAEKADFLTGNSYLPDYNYPRMNHLYDDFMTGDMPPMVHEKKFKSLLDMKAQIYKAVQELETASEHSDVNAMEYKLYAGFQEDRYKKILLIEAAEKLRTDNSPETRAAFSKANEQVFGAFHPEYFRAILDGSNAELFNPEIISQLGNVARDHYASELSAVPDTEDGVYYEGQQVIKIMNQALQNNGLAEKGWKAEINPNKTIVAVNNVEQKLYLPPNIRRNASELRRLMVHEIGVHATRKENGKATGERILTYGTAGYADVEEGLGVILECAVAGNFDNASVERAVERYIVAGYALGADGESPRDARSTFEKSWPVIAQKLAGDGEITDKIKDTARTRTYAHIENAFRGTNMYMQGMIYAKLKIYYEGLVDNIKYFTGHSDDLTGALDRALLGKYNHTSTDEYHTIEKLLESKNELASSPPSPLA